MSFRSYALRILAMHASLSHNTQLQRTVMGIAAAFSARLLMFVMVASSPWSVHAQDESLTGLFPGVEFSRHFADAETDLYASTYSRIESKGKEYVALTYYQPYPNARSLRYVSHALLERVGEEYELRLDQVATDDGSGLDFQKPFSYTLGTEDLVVFPSCYRGCRYSFFRIDGTPTRVILQSYDGLGVDESLSGRGTYRFDASGLSAAFRVARTGDASCCPSGGTLQVFYELRGNEFRIARVERGEAAQETGGRGEQSR